ncbi:hypothetical protein [Cohaesibacter gelatinilyticus]|uniref:hypothetical protein n=1 Tax=Cohaesibacter gelatinilyticus TaxID=372072 RepID=UPI000BE44A1F|nr:hypothetical protein [Cohaesibacter gelatinilyticus]
MIELRTRQTRALALIGARLIKRGYQVLVTADHGMDETGNHGGDADRWCYVPFFASPRLSALVVQPESL